MINPNSRPQPGVYRSTKSALTGAASTATTITVFYASEPDEDGFFLVETDEQELTNEEWADQATAWGLEFIGESEQ